MKTLHGHESYPVATYMYIEFLNMPYLIRSVLLIKQEVQFKQASNLI